MKKLMMFLIAAILFASAASANYDIYFSDYLTTNLNVSSSLDIVPTDPNYDLRYLEASLFFFPEGYENQFVTFTDTEPRSVKEKGLVKFRWTDVKEGTLNYGISTTVKVKNDIRKVNTKIKFPISDLQSDLKPYTESTEKVDSDIQGIISLANLLAQGEDDLYVVTHKLAAWVEDNIEYSLSTVTADVQQKASWVLIKKQGVCDEITVLFMALCRSLGIPAKFVSGTAYTESPLFPNRWGAHGWAEVYFPDYGWIPFDITYGELGWIDPSHIKLRESIDPTEPAVRFEWKGRYVNIETQPLEIEASIQSYGTRVPEDVKITASSLKGSIDFGSYDIVKAEVQNLRDYYVATDIMIAKASEIEMIDKQKVHVLLKPNQKKKLYWRIRVNPDLSTRYIYTIPLLVYTEKNLSKKVRITASVKEPHYTRGEIDEYYDMLKTDEWKRYSEEIGIECVKDKEDMYTYEDLTVSCTIQNTGNTMLNNINICIKSDCRTADLGITQVEQLAYNLNFDTAGKKDITISVKNEDIFQEYPMSIEVFDTPNIEIIDLSYDDSINYDSEGEIRFTLSRQSYSVPRDIKITLYQDKETKEWTLPELKDNQEFVVKVAGNEFTKEKMDAKLVVGYKDKREREYSSEEQFSISLEELTLWQKIKMYVNKIVRLF